jgi:hypothetical protein
VEIGDAKRVFRRIDAVLAMNDDLRAAAILMADDACDKPSTRQTRCRARVIVTTVQNSAAKNRQAPVGSPPPASSYSQDQLIPEGDVHAQDDFREPAGE